MGEIWLPNAKYMYQKTYTGYCALFVSLKYHKLIQPLYCTELYNCLLLV